MNTGNYIDYNNRKQENLTKLTCQELLSEKSRLESEIYRRKFAIEKEIRDKYDTKRALLKETFYKIGSMVDIKFNHHNCSHLSIDISKLSDDYRLFLDDNGYQCYSKDIFEIFNTRPEIVLALLYDIKIRKLEEELDEELKNLF